MPENIHPEFSRMLGRPDKERLLGQAGKVFWIYGLSGSGKSTLANALERELHSEGWMTQLLDGDNIRSGLNANLGFSDPDREENIRRIAEVAKLFVQAGVVTLTSFITPRRHFRDLARGIIGAADFVEIYVRCSWETCARRDVKGLYAKAAKGQLQQFTGKDSEFEEPKEGQALVVETEGVPMEKSLQSLYEKIAPHLTRRDQGPE